MKKEKALLRQYIRSLYPGREERDRESRALCGHILHSELYRNARVIGGYMPLPREADVTAVLEDALCSGRILALPLCGEAPEMTLRRVGSMEELVPGAYGIWEPREDTEIISVDALDLLLVPLEGIDPTGMRLGKGGGYYDRLLADAAVTTLGCALSWQWTERVPVQAWDRPLKGCADRDGILMFPPHDM